MLPLNGVWFQLTLPSATEVNVPTKPATISAMYSLPVVTKKNAQGQQRPTHMLRPRLRFLTISLLAYKCQVGCLMNPITATVFNGKENSEGSEWGVQLVQDYGFRLYNPAIGRFLSVDPLARQFPMLTPYQFASNSPIMAIDLDGLESKVAFIPKIPYKPVFDEDLSFLDIVGNVAHNGVTVLSNGFIVGTQNSTYSLWNFGVDLFNGEYNTQLLVIAERNIAEPINHRWEYHSETPIIDQMSNFGHSLEDALNALTDLNNWDGAITEGLLLVVGLKSMKLPAQNISPFAKSSTFNDAITLRDEIVKQTRVRENKNFIKPL